MNDEHYTDADQDPDVPRLLAEARRATPVGQIIATLHAHESHEWDKQVSQFVCRCGQPLGDSHPDDARRGHLAAVISAETTLFHRSVPGERSERRVGPGRRRPMSEAEADDLYRRWLQKTSFTYMTAAVEAIVAARVAEAQAKALEDAADELPGFNGWVDPRWLRTRAAALRPGEGSDHE